ncbi:uncharacterized protein LOC113272997 [Papaver somniferum]|uniref:uncharacterized protein LOC113272997 n=1 Tax=Papaver somniferum TaxID=3469 RepID=UPI000E6F46C2|nr:uncharacterized protein LOC113272997 [Papaver somniferum]
MAKPTSATPFKIRESTRFYPYFEDCIGAMDSIHIPAMVEKRNASVYRNRHEITSQNVLAVCNFDLEFIYVLSGWEGSAHDSKILNDAMTKRNGLKIPQEEEEDSHPSTLVNDDEILTQQTQEQQRQEANAWRKSITDDIREDVVGVGAVYFEKGKNSHGADDKSCQDGLDVDSSRSSRDADDHKGDWLMEFIDLR